MPLSAVDRDSGMLDRVILRVQDRIAPETAPTIERFMRLFFGGLSPEDLDERSADDLYGAALSMWRVLQQRLPGTPTVEILNPTAETEGWHSPHTVIAMVNDDMPFLVDSARAYLSSQGLAIHWINHPILGSIRDEAGTLESVVAPAEAPEAITESCILIEVDRRSNPETLRAFESGLERVLSQVRASVDGWQPILDRVYGVVERLQTAESGAPLDEIEETVAFLRWMADEHFTFLGAREYKIEHTGDRVRYRSKPKSALGLLRDPEIRPLGLVRGRASLPPDIQSFVEGPSLVMITKSAMLSPVHRAAPMDSIGVKLFDSAGAVVGESRFVGLFTSTVYSRSVYDIPLLRRRVNAALDRSALPEGGHTYKALEHILENLPRDELFQMSEEELLALGLGILAIEERQRTGLFLRRDPFGRFVSCLAFVPRERYDTALRLRVQRELERTFDSTDTSFTTQVSESPLARMHFVVQTPQNTPADYDTKGLEARITEAARSWEDRLRDAMLNHFGEERTGSLIETFGAAFPAAYREDVIAEIAVKDLERLERAQETDTLALSLYRRPEEQHATIGCKLYYPARPIPLSDLLPRLENLGLRVINERPYRVRIGPQRRESLWIHDLMVEDRDGTEIDLAGIRDIFEEAFERIWYGDAEDDGFNRLVIRAGLGWRQVALLRAVSRYLRQTGIPFSQDYMQDTLAENAEIAADLFRYFEARFDPAGTADHDVVTARTKILDALDSVKSLDQDRILRRFVNIVDSMLRTNYFQHLDDGTPKPQLSFKLDSRAVDGLPLPRPFVEIFVYSPRVEGVHLRGGKVARGGIRWSDRREDFRTEVLGLMKAQMVKNAVIVPVGAKGGFVLKRPPAYGGRAALHDEGVACYKSFIAGLLDLTDNRVGSAVVPPLALRRYDDDDPYLVVAADKGTATFSDIANGIAAEYGFWLGDAFASGGAAGYDHKAMGITARGAWESVKRHFREFGRDVQSEPVTVVGIGDMAGDVFGNGMLQSDQIRLVGAFNHRHIFIDPDPDPAKSYAERKRLFEEIGGWAEYDTGALSPGGVIIDRSEKVVELSDEARKRFGVSSRSLAPNDVIRAILRAEVDLIWFGGIGCFVRSSAESEADVGDHANDAVRTTARELRCRVIGEGANLALTQRARIEFAAAGGRLNSDAIDNSAGVDCSDHEVNIKIVLNDVVANGDMTEKQRRALLAKMTDEVATLVLRNNYLQTQAISVAESRAPDLLESHSRMIRQLERDGRLDRTVEDLPDETVLAERAHAGLGLTRPELAVLLAYAKTSLFADLLESGVPDDAYFEQDLLRYMPEPLTPRHEQAIGRHRLRREIIATSIANSIVNRGGVAFVSEMTEYTGATAGRIARAYSASRHIFGLRDLWSAIEALDNQVAAAAQTEMLLAVDELLERGTLWFLKNHPDLSNITQVVETYADGVARLKAGLDEMVSEAERERIGKCREKLEEIAVPRPIAHAIAAITYLFPACDIVDVAVSSGRKVEAVGRAYFTVGAELRLPWLRECANDLVNGDHWHHRAVIALVDDLYSQQRAACYAALTSAPDLSPEEAIAAWRTSNERRLRRTLSLFDELSVAGTVDLAMLAVANREIRTLLAA
jgi:glutamate dehydrogenase